VCRVPGLNALFFHARIPAHRKESGFSPSPSGVTVTCLFQYDDKVALERGFASPLAVFFCDVGEGLLLCSLPPLFLFFSPYRAERDVQRVFSVDTTSFSPLSSGMNLLLPPSPPLSHHPCTSHFRRSTGCFLCRPLFRKRSSSPPFMPFSLSPSFLEPRRNFCSQHAKIVDTPPLPVAFF